MNRIAAGNRGTAVALHNIHIHAKARLADERTAARHVQEIIVAGATAILHVRLDDGQKDATLLHLGIRQAERSE